MRMIDRTKKLAKTRPDMSCIFQTPILIYPRFTIYRTYIWCYGLNRLETYNTTELKEDIIRLDKEDKNLNEKLKLLGYDPEENVIYSFYLENDRAKHC